MIDSHCHLNFNAFKDDWREVLRHSLDNGITNIINIGSNYKTSERAIKIAKEFNQCRAAISLHPIHVSDEVFNLEDYRKLIIGNKNYIKAIGETGLDYFAFSVRERTERLQKRASAESAESAEKGGSIQTIKELQRNVFSEHLKLAKEFDLPLILHCRGEVNNPLEAYNDLLSIIHNSKFIIPGVIHCFSADWQIAQKFLNLGFFIGFTGIITFSDFSSAEGGDEKSRTRRSPALAGRRRVSDELLDVVAKVPLEKILIETDAPYLTPEPYRGQRCEPWHVKFTAQKIAAIKKISLEKIIEQTTQNAKKLFKI